MDFRLPEYPVTSALPELRGALAAHSGAVLCAPPGSGKTTLAPLALLSEPWLAGRKILLLEPRRMAARAAAWRMADIAGEPVGGVVGWHVRMERKSSASTRILVLTEGLLSRMVLSDPELSGVGLVIFDEFHERSLHADFGLALALDVQRALRPDLRILVMSATLDAGAVARHLGATGATGATGGTGGTGAPAPVIRAQGRMFPVETEFLPLPREPRIAWRVATGVRHALAERPGSVLAFLPGEGEIRACAALLEEGGGLPAGVDVLPLYAALPRSRQDEALRPSVAGRRRVVLATSIAESSLTIEGVETVVDSGLARVSRFSPDSGMSHLETIRISRDRADQRRGRAGRLGPGLCIRLWDEGEDRRLRPTAPPEIATADLAGVALGCAEWGAAANCGAALAWPTPPPVSAWRGAMALLESLDAVDSSGAITRHGRALLRFGAHPRLAQMMIGAVRTEALDEACLLAAALSEGLPASARPSTNAEHLVRDLEEGDGAVPAAARTRIREQAAAWRREAERIAHDDVVSALSESAAPSTGELLALAYPDRIARRRAAARDEGRYLTVGGRGARLPSGDPLSSRSDWIVVADIDEADADGAIRLAAPISQVAVMRLFGDRVRSETVVEWNSRTGKVDAEEREKLGAVVVRSRPAANPDPEKIAACLCVGVRSAGIGSLGWDGAAGALRARMAFLRRALPEESWPDVSDAALADSLELWLGPFLVGCRSLEEAAAADKCAALRSLLDPAVARELDVLAPERLEVPTGSRVRIDYDRDCPTASVRLQECFGMTSTPRVARGRVPVRMQLLSPAMRPVQVTDDLARFWREGYPLVRKEMRGRYPRHFWPEDGATAVATRRVRH